MKFETKAIYGIRDKGEGSQKESWGNTINMASTFQVREFGVEQEFEYARVSHPTRKEFEKIMTKLEKWKTWIRFFFRNGCHNFHIFQI